MSVRVVIVDGAIPAEPNGADGGAGDAGAVLVFEGLVRGLEEGRSITGLEYEVYEPMASRQLEAIAAAVVAEVGLLGLAVWHSRGRVGVGECSLRVVIRAVHRREALAGMDRFIDALKRDVPIWKRIVPES